MTTCPHNIQKIVFVLALCTLLALHSTGAHAKVTRVVVHLVASVASHAKMIVQCSPLYNDIKNEKFDRFNRSTLYLDCRYKEKKKKKKRNKKTLQFLNQIFGTWDKKIDIVESRL